jgi:DNA (cytosine-5)-methyltransferase 1
MSILAENSQCIKLLNHHHRWAHQTTIEREPRLHHFQHRIGFFIGHRNHRNRLVKFWVINFARIQTFPDDFVFYYKNLIAGYKMVGNAVPCDLAYCLGKAVKQQFELF